MKLVCDSGGTKASWMITGTDELIQTIGYNPHLVDAATMTASLRAELLPQLKGRTDFSEIHFYGAGCSLPKEKAQVVDSIRPVFPNAQIFVYHDLLGAARALCGVEPGIACILGTGSNSCLYDGTDVVDNVDSLGYMLGDEGSGCDLGRRLMRAYFYRELSPELKKALEEETGLNKAMLFDNVYGMSRPNRFLATFAKFCSNHRDNEQVHALVKSNFNDFIVRQVLKYEGVQGLPVHFVGSVARHFQSELETVLNSHNLTLGRIIKDPITSLVEFHA